MTKEQHTETMGESRRRAHERSPREGSSLRRHQRTLWWRQCGQCLRHMAAFHDVRREMLPTLTWLKRIAGAPPKRRVDSLNHVQPTGQHATGTLHCLTLWTCASHGHLRVPLTKTNHCFSSHWAQLTVSDMNQVAQGVCSHPAQGAVVSLRPPGTCDMLMIFKQAILAHVSTLSVAHRSCDQIHNPCHLDAVLDWQLSVLSRSVFTLMMTTLRVSNLVHSCVQFAVTLAPQSTSRVAVLVHTGIALMTELTPFVLSATGMCAM